MQSKVTLAGILGVLTLLSGFINYLAYPIILSALPVAEYAEMSVFLSLSAIFSIPASALVYVFMMDVRQNPQSVFSNFSHTKKRLIKFTLIYFIVAIVYYGIAFYLLWLHSVFATFLLIFASLYYVPNAFYLGFLRAKEIFIFFSIVAVASACVRWWLSFLSKPMPTVFVWVLSFILPAILSAIATVLYGFFQAKKEKDLHKNKQLQDGFSRNKSTIMSSVAITAIFVFLQNVDIILVRILFDTVDVATYAAASVIIKFILMFTGILETIVLPTMIDPKNSSQHALYAKILVGLSVWGIICSIVILPYIGDFLISIMKSELTVSENVWRLSGISMILLWFFVIFARTLVAYRYKLYTFFILPSLCMLLVFLAKTLDQFALVIMISIFILYIHILIVFAKNCKNFSA